MTDCRSGIVSGALDIVSRWFEIVRGMTFSWARLEAGRLAGHIWSIATRVRMPTRQEVRTRLDAFARWWASELWACLPSAWRNLLLHKRPHFLVTLQDDGQRVVVVERSNVGRSFSFALAPETKEDAASLAAIKRALKREGAHIAVVVPEASITRIPLKLPLTAQDELLPALGRHLENRDVYYDYSTVETDRETDTISLDAAVIPRAAVDKIVAALRGAGLNPSAAYAWKDGADGPDATFIRPPPERGSDRDWMLTVALIVLVLGMDFAAAYVPLWVRLDAIGDLQARTASIKPEVEDALRLERTLAELQSRNSYLVTLKNDTPSIAAVLGEVARVLPDSAWLEQLQVRDGRIRLAGFASAAAELTSTLEQSPMLSDVRFEWPARADLRPDPDRFDISAQIERIDRGSP